MAKDKAVLKATALKQLAEVEAGFIALRKLIPNHNRELAQRGDAAIAELRSQIERS